MAAALALLLSACQLADLSEDLETIEEVGFLSGTLDLDGSGQGPYTIALFADAMTTENLVNATVSETGDFDFSVLAGTYFLFAFEDVNRDFQYQAEEPAGFYGQPSPIEVAAKAAVEDIRITLRPNLEIPASNEERTAMKSQQQRESLPRLWAGRRNIGALADLQDSRFDQEVSDLGLWEPIRFSLEVGPGLFLLEPYDPERTPVLFVHGIGGTPRSFAPIIESLDRLRFQPWVYAYASGLPIAANADYLRDALTQLSFTYDFDSLFVVAHSMGGLVSRAFIDRYKRGKARYLDLFVTLSTPWAGHDAAQLAVDFAPVAAPAWVDMAPNSAFLEGLQNSELPEDLPHHLLFSFRAGGLPSTTANDGVVTLASQLDPKAQQQARRIYGFDTSHTEILADEDAVRLVKEILEEAYSDKAGF